MKSVVISGSISQESCKECEFLNHDCIPGQLRICERIPAGFRDVTTGNVESPSSIYEWLSASSFRRFVIQERLQSHPEIVRLTGSTVLQTVRIQSLATQAGDCIISECDFKMVTANRIVDNLHAGRTGNISAAVCKEDGSLRPAIRQIPDGIHVETIEHHPQTGIAIPGFVLPCWQDALALVRRAPAQNPPGTGSQ
jgi:hypothetical protein